MKRDEHLLVNEASRDEARLRVRREPMYFDAGQPLPFFGWYHAADGGAERDCVAVLCGPVGYEYTRAHRSMRHLADRFARRGIPALRFDYHGVGDSPGGDFDPDRLGAWQANIRTAICRARELSGRARVCLVGVRLGATLAAMVAAQIRVDSLVLWNPVATGRAYVRELQAIAATGEHAAGRDDGSVEAGGAFLSAETVAAVKAIELSSHAPLAERVLLVERDDLASDPGLTRYRDALAIPHDTIKAPGWNGMMADHQFTVVPDDALGLIVDWLSVHTTVAPSAAPPVSSQEIDDRIHLPVPVDNGTVAVEERLCRFGPDNALVGVVSRPEGDRGPHLDRPAVVLCNAGSVHRVGPNRLYVQLARELAARGYSCLRFDLEGIGDSVLRAPGRENHPYPPHAVRDTRNALQFMRWEVGATHFVLAGLCSGAHTAFHSALQLPDEPIDELLLVNPLTFHWVEGMTLATARTFEDMVQYKKSMRDPQRWLKLLRGEVNVSRMTRTAWSYVRTKAKSLAESLFEGIWPDHGPRLSRELRRLFERRRRVALFVADNDPGRDIVMTQARRTARRALESGDLRFDVIPAADHTFSRAAPRAELVARIVERLSGRSRTSP